MEMRDEKGVPLKPVPLTDRDGAARVCFSSFHFLLLPHFFFSSNLSFFDFLFSN